MKWIKLLDRQPPFRMVVACKVDGSLCLARIDVIGVRRLPCVECTWPNGDVTRLARSDFDFIEWLDEKESE